MSEAGPYPPYSMVLEWDGRGDIFVVTVPELAGCRTHGRTYEEAVRQGYKDAVVLETDPDLEPIRTLAGFQGLLKQLRAKASSAPDVR